MTLYKLPNSGDLSYNGSKIKLNLKKSTKNSLLKSF